MILILPGLLIRALASGHVRKNEALATSGPYAYTRNPLYLGSLLIGVGFAVAARSWWVGVALVVMFFAIYVPVIRDEEAFLRRTFPEFEEYARRVPRMFPHLATQSGSKDDPAKFSMGLYRKHREYNALIGSALLVCALILKMSSFPETNHLSFRAQRGISACTLYKHKPRSLASLGMTKHKLGVTMHQTHFFASNSFARFSSGRVEFDPAQSFSKSP